MTILPDKATPSLAALAPGFTRPTASRFTLPLVAALPAQGRRTVADPPRTLGSPAPGHRADY